MLKLPGDYIAGFVDGEGCFALKFLRDVKYSRKGSPTYFYWDIEFAIVLRKDDIEILEKIKKTLGCGKISLSKKGNVRYAVNNINELVNIITPFFEKYQLRAKKKSDFNLWKKALMILAKNQQKNIKRRVGQVGFLKIQWDPPNLSILKQIHQDMKLYKSATKDWKWIK